MNLSLDFTAAFLGDTPIVGKVVPPLDYDAP